MLGTADGTLFGLEVFHLYALECHGRGSHVVATTEGYGEDLGTCYEVHSLRTCEVDGIAQTHERSGQYLVAQGVYAILLNELGSAYGLLLCGEEHGIGVSHGSGLCGECSEVYGDGASLIVDNHGGKLALGGYHGDVASVHGTLDGVGVAILVGVVADLESLSVGDADGVGTLCDNYLGEGVAATTVARAIGAIEAQGVVAVIRVTINSLEPVQVLACRARCGVGRDLIEVATVVVYLEVGTFHLGVGHLDEVLAVVVACSLGVAEPLVGCAAVDVVDVLHASRVEGKLSIVGLGLRGCSQAIGGHSITTSHGVHMLRLSLVWHGRRRFNLGGLYLSNKQCAEERTNHKSQFSHGC